MSDDRNLYVEVMPRSGSKDDPGYERSGPFTPEEAAHFDAFKNWNLNHEAYHTLISNAYGSWRSERSLQEERNLVD